MMIRIGKAKIKLNDLIIFGKDIVIEAEAEKIEKAVRVNVKEWVKNKLKELKDSGVKNISAEEMYRLYNRETGKKSRMSVIKWFKRLAGHYGLNLKKRSSSDILNVFKLILSGVHDEIRASDVFKQAKVKAHGGYYYEILKKACDEQGFYMTKKGGHWYCVKKGRKPNYLGEEHGM